MKLVYIIMFVLFSADAFLFIYIYFQKIYRNRLDKLRDNRYETLMGYVMSYINKEKTDISDLSRTDKKLLRGICVQNFSSFAKEDRIAVGRLLKDMGEFRTIDRKIYWRISDTGGLILSGNCRVYFCTG